MLILLPDRVACQDATAQMALLQFMHAGKSKVAVPTTVHCDHLILAKNGAKQDLELANKQSKEVFDFLSSVSNKYGIGFGNPFRNYSPNRFRKLRFSRRTDDWNRFSYRKCRWF